jgi:hypothetical protein
VRVPIGSTIFSSPRRPYRLWGPPSLLPMANVSYFSRLKRPGREADHSLLSNTALKNTWIYFTILRKGTGEGYNAKCP